VPFLPFTIALGRPSRTELLILAGVVVLVGSAAGWVGTTAQQQPHAPDAPPDAAPLVITSTPAGAAVTLDGQDRGTTPLTLRVALGHHDIALHAQDAIDEARAVDIGAEGTNLDVRLWRVHPVVTYLKPPLPGATIVGSAFLDDGRLALQVALPDGERQAWTLDPSNHFTVQRLGEVAPHTPMAVRPDGELVAYFQAGQQAPTDTPPVFLDHAPATELWLAPTNVGSQPRRLWSVPEPTEELVDLTWAPDGQHLLLVGRQLVSGGAARTVIRWLDTATGGAQDLALLPSEVVPQSYVWSPDGQTVGILVHTASLAAVCTLTVVGDFRYLGDLGHDGLAGPPVAPVAWAPDGRLLYGGLQSQAPSSGGGFPFSNQEMVGLYLADPPDAPGQPVKGSGGALDSLWRPDGRVLATGLSSGSEGVGLRLRALDLHGQTRELARLELPTPGSTAYGVRWDLAHSRALVAMNRASNDGPTHDYWLVDFGWGVGS